MVTATGIFLGFLLNYGTSWIGEAFTIHKIKDFIIGTSMLLCIGLLMIVLYRMLNMRYPTDTAEVYYQKTLRLFILAISLPFVAFLLVIVHRLMVNTSTAT